MSKLKLIFDLAIGDGYLSKPKSDKANSCLVIKHSAKQAEYALYKKSLLESYGIKCSLDSYTDTKGHNVVQVRTMSSDLVLMARRLLYPSGVKLLSSEIIKNMDMFSFAILFQDDGSREHCKWHKSGETRKQVKTYINSFVLHLNSFSLSECENICERLFDFGIEARAILRKGRPTVVISKKKSKMLFVNEIYKFLHPSMHYKMDCPVFYHGDI